LVGQGLGFRQDTRGAFGLSVALSFQLLERFRRGGASQPPGQQEITGVAIGDFFDVARLGAFHVLNKYDFHAKTSNYHDKAVILGRSIDARLGTKRISEELSAFFGLLGHSWNACSRS
jgi:hypothetical protein